MLSQYKQCQTQRSSPGRSQERSANGIVHCPRKHKDPPERHTKPRPHIWAPSGQERGQVQIPEGRQPTSRSLRHHPQVLRSLASALISTHELRSEPQPVTTVLEGRCGNPPDLATSSDRAHGARVRPQHHPRAARNPSPSSMCQNVRKRGRQAWRGTNELKQYWGVGVGMKACHKGRHLISLPFPSMRLYTQKQEPTPQASEEREPRRPFSSPPFILRTQRPRMTGPWVTFNPPLKGTEALRCPGLANHLPSPLREKAEFNP